MRQPQTFILTVLQVDQDQPRIRGRVRSLASERETTFTHAEELLQFVRTEVSRLQWQAPVASAGEADTEEEPQ